MLVGFVLFVLFCFIFYLFILNKITILGVIVTHISMYTLCLGRQPLPTECKKNRYNYKWPNAQSLPSLQSTRYIMRGHLVITLVVLEGEVVLLPVSYWQICIMLLLLTVCNGIGIWFISTACFGGCVSRHSCGVSVSCILQLKNMQSLNRVLFMETCVQQRAFGWYWATIPDFCTLAWSLFKDMYDQIVLPSGSAPEEQKEKRASEREKKWGSEKGVTGGY